LKDFIKQGITMKDATYLACAVKAGCDYFLTTDDILIRRYNGETIKVRTPLTFLKDMEDETNA
jgi:predicted nucleic acid-binding protein